MIVQPSVTSDSRQTRPLLELLDEQGFLVLRQILPEPVYSPVRQAIDHQRVNYDVVMPFIHQSLLPTVGRVLDWSPTYTKCRISDFNNSTDAGSLHRDIINYGSEQDPAPIYTCLSYLDETDMEVIPGSHRTPSISLRQALWAAPSAQRLTLRPGDILVFQAQLLHRGIFTQTDLPHRRLIQVFELYPHPLLEQAYTHRILHLYNETPRDYGGWFKTLSRFNFMATILNYLGYLNAATGYGSLHSPLDHLQLDYDFVSSEGPQCRLPTPTGWQPSNLYVINGTHHPSINQAQHRNLMFWIHESTLVLMGFFLVVTILLILWTVQRRTRVQ